MRSWEHRKAWPGLVAGALGDCRHFLGQPGRWLYLPLNDCPCCDPVERRDQLQWALSGLPPRARRELGRVVAALDEEFERRTLPDPHSPPGRGLYGGAWWHHRLAELT
ncbi:hypothetical protein BWI15_34685 [Kribbella sp. ALI-6-A]|nr:hypothetical protein BWI15_34685 [Kribbella sp. ALI-6-A]